MEIAGFSHVALTVRDINLSRDFYTRVLGLAVLDSNESYCALLIGSRDLSALILTSHPESADEEFSEFRAGLDHVSLAVPTVTGTSSQLPRSRPDAEVQQLLGQAGAG